MIAPDVPPRTLTAHLSHGLNFGLPVIVAEPGVDGTWHLAVTVKGQTTFWTPQPVAVSGNDSGYMGLCDETFGSCVTDLTDVLNHIIVTAYKARTGATS